MAARGARSRKDMVKKVKKEEKKQAENDFLRQFSPTPSGTDSGWAGFPQKRNSFSSNDSSSLRNMLRSANGQRPPPSRSGSVTTSDNGSKLSGSKDGQKYTTAHGKETKAPRGRGGGVPPKMAGGPGPRSMSAMSAASSHSPDYLSPTALSPPANPTQKTWSGMKLWVDNKRAPQPYAGFDQVSSFIS